MLAREGEKGKEKDEDIEKGKVFFYAFHGGKMESKRYHNISEDSRFPIMHSYKYIFHTVSSGALIKIFEADHRLLITVSDHRY